MSDGVVRVASSTRSKVPTAVALGNFDGVHRGHERTLCGAIECGRDRGWLPTAVTFVPHPREFFSGHPHQMLALPEEKAVLLQSLGIERVVALPFNRELARLSPRTFVEGILRDRLQTRSISIGQDFCFGRDRAGTAADLKTIAADSGIEVTIVPLYYQGEDRVSSSAIRQALLEGNLDRANRALGRTYSLSGRVITGQQLGRSLGFPTANLEVSPRKFLPRWGVYAVWVRLPECDPLPGVANIGCRPTVVGDRPTVEVHLLAGGRDLYGETMTANLVRFLRPERRFDSLEALKAQIEIDCQQGEECLQEKV